MNQKKYTIGARGTVERARAGFWAARGSTIDCSTIGGAQGTFFLTVEVRVCLWSKVSGSTSTPSTPSSMVAHAVGSTLTQPNVESCKKIDTYALALKINKLN